MATVFIRHAVTNSEAAVWRDLIFVIDPDVVCQPPASVDQLARLEAAIGERVPTELAELLHEMDGVDVAQGVSLVWSADEIARQNARLRREWRTGGELESYRSFRDLLVFGEIGNGDLYAFPITPSGLRDEVFVWDHEDGSRTCIAPSLSAFLHGKHERT